MDLFLNLFTSVFVYGLPIFLLVAFVLGSAFCVSSNVPTFVYRAAAAPVGAAALPVLDPDRGIRVKFFVQGKKCRRPDEFVPHGLTARQVLDRLGVAADAEAVEYLSTKGRKYSDDEVVAAPVVVAYMRLRLRGGAPKKKRKTTSTEKPSTEERSTQTETEAMDSDSDSDSGSGSEDDGAECCCIVRKEGVCKACPKKAHYRVSIVQMEKTINDKTRSKRKGKLFFDRTKVDDDDAYRVCEEHLVAAAKAHMQQVAKDKGGSEKFDKRNFLQNILKATDTHENKTARPVQPGSKRARVSTDTKATPEKKDLLTELFERMRPYCKPRTFVYNILMTIFRHVLIMNKVYEYGRNVYERTGKRAFVLKTKTERDKEHGVARRARVGEAPKILTKIAAATNVTVKNFKLTFRDAWVRAKYGRKASKGRSMLEMAMAAPHLLKREGASGNGKAFPVARAFIVDGDAAWELVHSKPHAAVQKVGTPTIKCRQSNLKGVLELDVLGKEKYVVPYKSIKAMAWDFIDASLPANVDGIVVVTFAIVAAGQLQLLTLELLQKDKNTCRMFANLAGLQNTLFKSALVAGGDPSPQAQLLRAAHREGGSGTAVLDLERDEAPWRRVAVRTAVAASRGLVRIAEVDAEEPPPLSTILKKYKGGDGITMRKEAIRSSSTTKAKRGRPKAKEDDGARVVRAELENHEEAARYQKDGGKVLGEKWVGLCVRDDEYRFAGEIVGMKWVDDTDPPQICAEIRSYDKKVTQTYCVYDLPAMVIAAEDEQLLDVLLEYDPPEDEFDLPGDEEAERTMAQPLGPDDDDGAEDDDVDLEL